jgi:hypothetical protein
VLPLESERWRELADAYGTAEKIPELLRQLSKGSPAEESEVWFSLWSALAHQGDVYSASFAAVPHIIEKLSTARTALSIDYLQFPAWVEICRAKSGVAVPEYLATAYFAALARIPALVVDAAAREWSSDYLRCALAAIAAAKGGHAAAEVIIELSPEVAQQFLDWFFSQ